MAQVTFINLLSLIRLSFNFPLLNNVTFLCPCWMEITERFLVSEQTSFDLQALLSLHDMLLCVVVCYLVLTSSYYTIKYRKIFPRGCSQGSSSVDRYCERDPHVWFKLFLCFGSRTNSSGLISYGPLDVDLIICQYELQQIFQLFGLAGQIQNNKEAPFLVAVYIMLCMCRMGSSGVYRATWEACLNTTNLSSSSEPTNRETAPVEFAQYFICQLLIIGNTSPAYALLIMW